MSKKDSLTIYCVYNAKGSIIGEISYLLSKFIYGSTCSMCQISHNTITQKSKWINQVSESILSIETLHLDEQPQDLKKFTKGKTPCVVGEYKGNYEIIFLDRDLKDFEGNVDTFFERLESKTSKIFKIQ